MGRVVDALVRRNTLKKTCGHCNRVVPYPGYIRYPSPVSGIVLCTECKRRIVPGLGDLSILK